MTRRHVYTTPAQRIEQLRQQYGSYRAVAERTGIALGQLHGIATGKEKNCTANTIRKLGLEARYQVRGGT